MTLAILVSCTNNGNKLDYYERMNKAASEYSSLMTTRNKLIVENFKNEKMKVCNKTFKKIDGGFYCLWNRRNIDIYPDLALNNLFKDNGYNITLHPDSLNYILICETKSHRVGTYSNGGKASKLESIISIIDLKTEKLYEVEKVMGGDPPLSTRNRDGAIGSHWSPESFYYTASKWIK